MSKVIVISTVQTNHVLAAATRTINPGDDIDPAEFLVNGLNVRSLALPLAFSPPANVAANLHLHSSMHFPQDQLTASLVDVGHNVLREPRNVYLKIPEDGPPELAAVQADHRLQLNSMEANGNVKVTIPKEAFDQEPAIVVWCRVQGAGSEVNATPVTAELPSPPDDVTVTLNVGPLQLGPGYTVMAFAGSLRPVIHKHTIT